MIDWLAAAANLDDDQVQLSWSWRENPGGETLQVRDALYGLFERELDVVAASEAKTYASAQMALAQSAFGDLRGLLAGLADQILDSTSRRSEWTIRQILQHVLEVELSYRTQVEWALARKNGEPVERPGSLKPMPEETILDGGISSVVDRIGSARLRSDSSLNDIKENSLGRPTIWAGYNVDVAFRLRRFASHLTEHTIQVEKALDAIGIRIGEARRIVRRISATRGLHELRTDSARLGELDHLAALRISQLI